MTDTNWAITLGVTCTEQECEDLMVEVLELADGRGFGAAVAARREDTAERTPA